MTPSTKLSGILIVVAVTACSGPSEPRGQAGDPARKEKSGESPATSAQTEEMCSGRPVRLHRPEVRAVAFARGDGPVYVGLGTADKVRYREDTREHEGWYYYKTLWAVAPEYEGRVSVTGHQLDGPDPLLFSTGPFPGIKLRALEMPPDSSGGWRYGPSDTLIRAPGCYAFEVRGEGFRQVVTFVAVR
jgi:hypothetical protein